MEKTVLSAIPAGHDGDGYITVNGKVEAAFRIAKISAELDILEDKHRFLGERMTQHAARGIAGSGKISYYHTTSALIDAMKKYANGGDYPDITIQYYAKRGESRLEVALRKVVISNISFGELDDNSDKAIVNESDFTFDGFDVIERF
ncbi:MAG: hypothetical protein J5968_03720 [Oscillospiraceae bacterium]|nr:hypothetical protein [Oscillospiraceae bacterium]